MKPREVLCTLSEAYVNRFQTYLDRHNALKDAMAATREPAVARGLVDMMTENKAALSQLWRDVSSEYDVDTAGQPVEFDQKLGAVVRK